MLSPRVDRALAREGALPLSPTPGPADLIRQEIKEVFGKDYDKAMLLLQGEGCRENMTLSPTAVNVNKDGSKDVGLFQINEKWHKIAPKWLLNYSINIRVAKQLYDESGDSFRLWTCGKFHSI